MPPGAWIEFATLRIASEVAAAIAQNRLRLTLRVVDCRLLVALRILRSLPLSGRRNIDLFLLAASDDAISDGSPGG